VSPRSPEITPELLVRAYRAGIFPMAESADDPALFWVDPRYRGILPLDGFHVPRRLRRTVRQGRFEMSCDTDFAGVMRGCAGARPETWINAQIFRIYGALHEQGLAHSVEARQEGRLVGGLYGVAIGGAFFGESMFSLATDASKVALVHLVAILRRGGFVLLDTQFLTDHLGQFGTIEIPRAEYRRRLAAALEVDARFQPGFAADPLDVLQSSTQTS
jgi:leucyl/phenylalanyl-tRNA--protein transferase